MFPEGTDSKASAGYLYSIGGFCILDTVNPNFIHPYRFQPLKEVSQWTQRTLQESLEPS